jgi:hypothetical protein
MSSSASTITANRSSEISYNIIPQGYINANRAFKIIKNTGTFITGNVIEGNIESNESHGFGGIYNNTGNMEIKNNKVFEGIFSNVCLFDGRITVPGIRDNTARFIRNNVFDETILGNTLCGPIEYNGYNNGLTNKAIYTINGNIIYGRVDTDGSSGSRISNNYAFNIANNTCQGISNNSNNFF